MGTRSLIVLEKPKADGSSTFKSIYCHWDGYPKNNYRILFQHYQDLEKVKELIALGDISCLGEEIGEKHDFEKHSEHENWVSAYHRDRGEPMKDVKAKISASLEDLGDRAEKAWAEFVYVFNSKTGKWTAYKVVDEIGLIKIEVVMKGGKVESYA